MRLYKAQVCPFADELKVAKFFFPSPLQFSFSLLWLDRNLLSRSSPPIYEQSLFLIGYGPLFGLLFAVVAFAFTYVAVVAAVVALITLGNVVRVYPEAIQGLTFYHTKIYITTILACVTSIESLLWSPQLVTSIT